MKKSLFFVATAALVLASCSNDVKIDENTTLVGSNEQREIAFTPYAKTPKRAASADPEYNAVEGVAFPKNYDMKVVAYSVPQTGDPGNYFGSATANDAPLFSLISSGEGAGYWGGSTAKQYWPLYPATLNFLAVTNNGSPSADVVAEQFGSPDYASQVTVTLGDNKPQATSTSTIGQHDLMYAFGRASVTQNGNVLVIPQCVNMEFNHALAWVYFRVKAGNAASEAISIKDIKLKGANYGGTFQAKVSNYNVTSPNLAWDAENTKWTAASNDGDYYSPNFSADYNHRGASGEGDNDSKSLVNGTFFNVGDGILVVPTSDITPTAPNSITSFDIEYYLNGTLCTYNYIPTERVFSKGKKYIYDITMTLHEIFVNASVADWDTDLNGNDEEDDHIMVDFPAVSTAHKTNLEITANEGGKYTVKVTGLGATEAYTIAVTDASDIITVDPTNGSADANGVATLTFNVKAATTGEKTATITLTPNTTDGTTVITVKQTAL